MRELHRNLELARFQKMTCQLQEYSTYKNENVNMLQPYNANVFFFKYVA